MIARTNPLPRRVVVGKSPLAVSVLKSRFAGAEIDMDWQQRPLGRLLADLTLPSGASSRRARLNVSFGLLGYPQTPWAARFWEADPPPGVQPIDWLFSSRNSVTCLEDALELLSEVQDLVTSYAVI